MKKIMSIFLSLFMLLTMSCTAFAEEKTVGIEPGEKIPDFTVTTTDGETFTLSEVLKEKDLVVLNIFASWCQPCEKEFPEMEEVYQENKDNMEIISLSKEPEDTMEIIADYKASHGLSFPMGLTGDQFDYLGITGVPTTIMIDRFGNVGFVKVGAFTSKEEFEARVQYFTSPNYDGTPLVSEKAVSFTIPILIYVAVTTILGVIGKWLIFRKAGTPGWYSLIPILNTCKEYSLCWNTWIGLVESLIQFAPIAVNLLTSGLGIIGTMIPSVFLYALRLVESIKLAKTFGKGTGYGVFLTIFYAFGRVVLGLSKAEYQGKPE